MPTRHQSLLLALGLPDSRRLFGAVGAVERRHAAPVRCRDGADRAVGRGAVPFRAGRQARPVERRRALDNLAVAYEALGRFDDARHDLRASAVQVDPGNVEIKRNQAAFRGVLRELQGRPGSRRAPGAAPPARPETGSERQVLADRCRSSPPPVLLSRCSPLAPRRRRWPSRSRSSCRSERGSTSRVSDSIAFAPFIVLSKEGEDNSRLRNLDVQREFERYVSKLDQARVRPRADRGRPVDYPSYDLALLEKNCRLLARARRAARRRPHPLRQPRLRHPGSHRLPQRGVRLAVRRPAPTTGRCWSRRPASTTTS